jgi:hypothetical protein
MISDIYYDKPWGIELSSNAAEDIRNEYRFGEGETGKEIFDSVQIRSARDRIRSVLN